MFSRFESNKNMLQHLNRPCHGGIRTLLYSISQRKMIRQQAILYILHSLILLNTKTHLITLNTCIWVPCLCKCLCSCVEYNSEVRCLLCCELWALIWLLKTSVTTDLGCFVMLHSTDRQEKKKKSRPVISVVLYLAYRSWHKLCHCIRGWGIIFSGRTCSNGRNVLLYWFGQPSGAVDEKTPGMREISLICFPRCSSLGTEDLFCPYSLTPGLHSAGEFSGVQRKCQVEWSACYKQSVAVKSGSVQCVDLWLSTGGGAALLPLTNLFHCP